MRPILTRSEITGSVYITTKYKALGSGELDTYEKYDVTREFDAIVGGIVAENEKLHKLLQGAVSTYMYENCVGCCGELCDECDCIVSDHADELRELGIEVRSE